MIMGRLHQLARDLCGKPRGEDGTVAVEYGFVLPAIMLTIYGMLEVGRVLFVKGMLLFATEEATRFATVNHDATVAEIQAVAEDHMIWVDFAKITDFDVTSDLDPVDQTKLVGVEVTYAYDTLLPMPWGTMILFAASRGFLVDQ